MPPKILFINKNFKKNKIQINLKKRGYSILKANNGLKLISHLEVEHPDLIIMDTKSTWPDSFTLCKSLRKGKYKSIPVFFVTNQSTKKEYTDSFRCGCTQYFCLPSQFDTFYKKVQEFAGIP
ncbi:MAG: response regulator [Myxococcota bacterium]